MKKYGFILTIVALCANVMSGCIQKPETIPDTTLNRDIPICSKLPINVSKFFLCHSENNAEGRIEKIFGLKPESYTIDAIECRKPDGCGWGILQVKGTFTDGTKFEISHDMECNTSGSNSRTCFSIEAEPADSRYQDFKDHLCSKLVSTRSKDPDGTWVNNSREVMDACKQGEFDQRIGNRTALSINQFKDQPNGPTSVSISEDICYTGEGGNDILALEEACKNAVSGNDTLIVCNLIPPGLLQSRCYKDTIKVAGNCSVCDKLPGGDIRDYCYLYAVEILEDPRICEKILNPGDKDRCYKN